MSNKFVAYYRKSPGGNKTKSELDNSLGIAAQHNAIATYLRGNSPLAEFTDLESGKMDNRPQLLKALELCKKENATLVIAKLDRLSRNLTFISTLMDNNVKFVCCDMPDANEMTIHIFAALAQAERKRISERTKDALAVLKKKGVKLGNPQNLTATAREAGVQAVKEKAHSNPNNKKALAVIQLFARQGKPMTLTTIASYLNDAGLHTSKGAAFKPESVRRLLSKVTL